MKGAKTISLIHDIGSIRTHRLTPTQEVKRLSHSDYILASNTKMTEWLKAHGMKKPMGALGLFFGWVDIILISVMAFLFAAIVSLIILILRKKNLNEYKDFYSHHIYI